MACLIQQFRGSFLRDKYFDYWFLNISIRKSFQLSSTYSSVISSPEHKIRVLCVLGLELLQPLIQKIRRDDYVLSLDPIDQQSTLIVADHIVVQILRHELRVLLLAISGNDQVLQLLKSLGLDAELHRGQPGQLGTQGEASGEDIGGPAGGDGAQVLQIGVGGRAEVEPQGQTRRQLGCEGQADVGHRLGVGDVHVVDVVVEVEVGDRGQAWQDYREGQRHY